MMSSLFIGATGLKGHAEGMSVVANNLANVNTLGFKQKSMTYQDLMSQYQTAGSNHITNMSQKGMGVMPGDVRTLFTQGGFEAGSASTDMAISGGGFFGVTNKGDTQYTRSGDFRFTKEGALVNPNGWTLLGHKITAGVEAGSTTPIQIDMTASGVGYMPPKATSQITSASRLGAMTDKSADAANPFFAMAAKWDGTSNVPLGTGAYSYAEPISFYDSKGTLQSGNIYYDLAGTNGGNKAVEYIVTMNPSKDGSDLAGTEAAGLLMAGTLTFNSSGQLINQTAFTPPSSGDPTDLSGWKPAGTQGGTPVFSATPTGAAKQSIALDMGLTLATDAGAGLASAADAAGDPGAIFGISLGAVLHSVASNTYSDSNGTISQKIDGYTAGELRDVTVSADGTVVGIYTNNQSDELYRISMYRFASQDGLKNVGDNHYAAGPEAGAVEEGVAGTENFGSIQQFSLEQSNADYAREFSTMIITQRGFQMNSKVITTSDMMLQKALELKR